MLNLAFFISFFWFRSRPLDSFYLSQLSQIVLVLICIIETVVLFLPGCFRSVFGRELLLGCWRCEIFAYSAPDTALGVRVKTFLRADSGRFGLRHAIYKNPEIAPYIAAWLTASVKGKNELID
jgi:hypothetical protein